ncbi:YchJ family metal-binding protein [Syntrophotalea acetylenica]|jgi:hypothetical protein
MIDRAGMADNSGKNAHMLQEAAQLVLNRCEAFRRNDFRFIFSTYHKDAPFLQAFATCEEYLQYARQHLQGAFRILSCRVIGMRSVAGDEAQVLFCLEVACSGVVQSTVELACIRRVGEKLHYHSGAKRNLSEFSGRVENITFEDFLDSDSLLFF